VFNQLYVDFYDVSNTTGLTAYSWDFGDGLGTSTAQHPSYTYNVAGFYQVCLTVTDHCGSDTYCESINVNASSACPTPVVNFQYQQSQGTLSAFDGSTTSGPATYAWDFGDGGTSTAQNPTYIYNLSGLYLLCLTVTDSCGSSSRCDSIAISAPCQGPTADFVATTFLPGHIDFHSFSSTSGTASF
jgi:PKD repeat protein